MESIHQQLDNFLADAMANIKAASNVVKALDALRAITLDALLLEQRIKNDPNNTQTPTDAE